MSIPSSSSTNSFGRRSSSSRLLPGELVGEQGGRSGGDRASLAVEGDLRDLALAVEADRHVLLVAAERVGVLVLEVGILQPPEVVGPLVVLEDLVAVELVHASRLADVPVRLAGICARPGSSLAFDCCGTAGEKTVREPWDGAGQPCSFSPALPSPGCWPRAGRRPRRPTTRTARCASAAGSPRTAPAPSFPSTKN